MKRDDSITFYSALSAHYHPPCFQSSLSSVPSTRPSLGFGNGVGLGGPAAGGTTTTTKQQLPLKHWITRLHLQHLLIPGGYRCTWRDTHQWARTGAHIHNTKNRDESAHINIITCVHTLMGFLPTSRQSEHSLRDVSSHADIHAGGRCNVSIQHETV